MLEFRAVSADVLGCYGQPAALDRLDANSHASIRVAPDELLLLAERSQLVALREELNALDTNGLAIDLSSSFSAFAIVGEARLEAFGRLSEVQLPDAPATIQGLVAGVPAKVLVRDDELLMLVSSVLSEYVREQVLSACRDLPVVDASEVREKQQALRGAVLG